MHCLTLLSQEQRYEKIRQIKENMAKRRVYTLYGDAEALEMVIGRLVENSFAFHYTGEFLYGNAPWDEFIGRCCGDIKDRLVARIEEWADLDEAFDLAV